MNYRHNLRHRYYNITRRCNESGRPDSKAYYDKGIRCEWPTSADFVRDMMGSFITHVKDHGIKNTTLDRIDPDGNYSKENCRWATWQVQRRNNSLMKWYDFNGKKLTLHELADTVNINWMTLWHRMNKGGKTLEQAVAMPFKPRTKGNKWAQNFMSCIKCATSKTPYQARGLCRNCYQKIVIRKVWEMPQ